MSAQVARDILSRTIDAFHLPGGHEQQSHAGGDTKISDTALRKRALSHEHIKPDPALTYDHNLPVMGDAESDAEDIFDAQYSSVSEHALRRRILDSWTEGSDLKRSLLLEAAASELWGGEINSLGNVYSAEAVYEKENGGDSLVAEGGILDKDITAKTRAAYKKFAGKQYALTQKHARSLHPDGYVTLYRGVKNRSGYLGEGDIEIETDALSSWTAHPRTSTDFVRDVSTGRIVAIRVPVEDIFAAPFSSRELFEYGEMEYVLIGRGEKKPAKAWKAKDFKKQMAQWESENSSHVLLAEKFRALQSELDRFSFHRAYGGALYETRTNQYEAELIRIYERWTAETAKRFIRAANTAARNTVVEDALLELEEELVNAGRKGLLDAMQLGSGDNELSPRGYEKLAEAITENEQYIANSLMPAIRIRMQVALNDEQFLRGGEVAIKGLLQSYNGRVGSYAGAYWRAIFAGVGNALSQEQDTRRVEWELDPAAEHCDDCIRNAGIYDSFDALELGVGLPGERVRCRANCRCIVKIETEPGSGKFERMSDMRWLAELFHLPGEHDQQNHAGDSDAELRKSAGRWTISSGQMLRNPELMQAVKRSSPKPYPIFRGEHSDDYKYYRVGEEVDLPYLHAFTKDYQTAAYWSGMDEDKPLPKVILAVEPGSKSLDISPYAEGALRKSEQEHLAMGKYKVTKKKKDKETGATVVWLREDDK